MKRLFAIVFTLLVFCGCEKETLLTVDQTSINISDAGGSQTVTLTTNKPWSVSSTQSWCKVSPSGGEEAAGSRISISCDANTTYDARTCTVTFTCAEITKSVTVSQATNNGLQVSQTTYEVTKAAQQLNIEVKANVKFSVEVDNGCKDWVKYNTTKALTTSTVILDIAENKSYDGREGKVTIKQDGGSLSSTITIKQSQLDGLFLTTSEYNLSNEKHTLTVEVSTNVEFDVKPEADWVKYIQTKGLRTKQIVLEVAENDTYDQRETKVNVKQKNGDLSGTITIKQDEKYGILVSQSEYNLTNEAQTIEVEVKYNVDFEVSIPDGCKDWIKQVSTKGLSTKNYTFSIAKNETYDAREGSITFKQKHGALSGTVSVKQSQNNGLFVTKSDYEISDESQTVSVEVKANIEFEVKSETEWVKVVETKGLKTSTITLRVEENDSYDLREGKVSVKQIDGDLSGDITIKQKGKNGIILPQTEYELTNEAQTLNVEVQTTVAFEVIISDSGKDWVSLVSTKALDSKTCSFSIKKNDTYDSRECTVTIKQKGGEMSNSFTIKQAQTDILEVSPTEFTLDVEGGTISVNVKSNIGYDIAIAEDAVSWISQVETKAPETETISFIIASCADDVERTGKITISKKDFKFTITIQQYSSAANTNITFADPIVKKACVEHWDINGDGELSLKEARKVTIIPRNLFGSASSYVLSFDEMALFANLKEIEPSAFASCVLLESISFPSSLEILGPDAFYYCPKLKTVKGGENIHYIGAGAFEWDSSLSDIILSSHLTSIFNRTFSECSNLVIKQLPNSITDIGDNAFKNCKRIALSELPTSIVTIGLNAFSGCPDVSISEFPSTLITIGSYAFASTGIKGKVIIPDSIQKVGGGAFVGCDEIEEVVIGDSLQEIEDGTFYGIKKLKRVTIGRGVLGIGQQAFCECVALEHIIIPDNVVAIGNAAFWMCNNLKTVQLGNSLRSCGDWAFSECHNLESFSGSTATKDGKCFILSDGILYGFAEKGTTSYSIPNEVIGIASAVFKDNDILQNITLPSELRKIGSEAFRDCDNLTSIAIPDKVQSIGEWCFYSCDKLSSLTIGKGIKEFDSMATFQECKNLTEVSIPDNVEYLAAQTFFGCDGIRKVVLGKGIKRLGTNSLGISGLPEVWIYATTPPNLSEHPFYRISSSAVLYVPNGYISVYEDWNQYFGGGIKEMP